MGRELAVSSAVETRDRGPRPRELAYAALGLLSAMLASTTLGRGWGLFTSPAWLDEYHSLFVAGRGTFLASLTALAQGADFCPPLLPTLQRLVGAITGGLDLSGRDMLSLRLLSFGSVWAALVAVYAILRIRLGASAAFIGAFALWTHPLVVQHSFDARFYGPWLAFAALFVWALDGSERTSWRLVAIAACAIALCLVHYFGVITWSLAVAAYLFRRRSESAPRFRSVLAAALGPLALVACLPIYLGQRASLSVATWVRPPTLDLALLFPVLVLGPLLLVASVAWGAARFAPAVSQPPTDARMATPREAGCDLLLVMGLTPVALVAFSLAIQPALIDRYAIVGILGLGPVVAVGISKLDRRWHVFMVAACVALAGIVVNRRANRVQTLERQLVALDHALTSRVGPGALIVSDERHTLYPLSQRMSGQLAGEIVYAEVADSMRARLRDFDIVERDVARVHARLYGLPALQRVEALRLVDHFWLVSRDNSETTGTRWFPEHEARHVAPDLYEMTLANRTTFSSRLSGGQ